MPRWIRARRIVAAAGVRCREQRGQALVEFAIVLPILLGIIVGIIYFGKYEDYNNQMTQLAEQGARMAAIGKSQSGAGTACGSQGGLQGYIADQAQGELQNGGTSDVAKPLCVWIDLPGGGSYGSGAPIRVCVSDTVKFLPLVTSISPTLTQSATFPVETLVSGSTGSTNPYNSTNPTTPDPCT